MDPNAVARAVIDAAMTVHTELGPGLLESAYECCLAYELTSRELFVQRQVPVAVSYREVTLAWICWLKIRSSSKSKPWSA